MSILDGSPGLSVGASASSPPSFPLDFMSVMPIAAWWTRKLFSGNVADDISALRLSDSASQNIPFAPNGVIDAANLAAFSTTNNSRLDVWYDQVPPGANLNLSGGFFNQGPKIYDGVTGIELQGNIPVANFNGDSLGRNDALGLVGDPALTIAWNMKLENSGTFPSLLTLGPAAVGNEIVIFFDLVDAPGFVEFSITDVTGAFGVFWFIPVSTAFNYQTFIVTKPNGSGFNNSWRLKIDGIDQGVPTVIAAPINLVDTFMLLGDFFGGGLPFIGKLPGMIIYNSVIAGNDMIVLQSFLNSQKT